MLSIALVAQPSGLYFQFVVMVEPVLAQISVRWQTSAWNSTMDDAAVVVVTFMVVTVHIIAVKCQTSDAEYFTLRSVFLMTSASLW